MNKLIARFRLWRISRALEIKVYPQVKAFVLHNDARGLGKRTSGLTTASILKALVRKQIPYTVSKISLLRIFCNDKEFVFGSQERVTWYQKELMTAICKCEEHGIHVRQKSGKPTG